MSDSQPNFQTIAILGVGMIGGSIALAARERGLSQRVVGVGRSDERLQHAIDQGVIDEGLTDVSQLSDVDLVIVCTPVDRIAEDVAAVFQATPSSTFITDVGSVKVNLCQQTRLLPEATQRFLGAHPLAGSHRSGFENADPQLYEGRKCVITPWEDSAEEVVQAIASFWSGLGLEICSMPADEHDRILAMTSHLPHLTASALAGLVETPALDFAATGFRDTTRVAAGDPVLWAAIFLDNAEQVIAATDEMMGSLQAYRDALQLRDRETLTEMLLLAQKQRLQFQQLQNKD